MSTRSMLSFIPYKKGLEWEGVYCHFDGYPSTRGKQIWDILHKDFLNNKGTPGVGNSGDPSNAIHAFIEIYIKGHKGGWSSFPDQCYCHDPAFVMRDGVRASKLSNSKYPDPLYIEWLYVLDEKSHRLKIYTGRSNPDFKGDLNSPHKDVTLTNEGYWDYGTCQYRHELVADIDLLGDEPDWEHIEETR